MASTRKSISFNNFCNLLSLVDQIKHLTLESLIASSSISICHIVLKHFVSHFHKALIKLFNVEYSSVVMGSVPL